ncbi:MAG: hypothetical protein BWY58_01095 [Chloroflexi bacterium ADurb.Bin344]|nr:MAG: hypothetical protein BWY58_01095 [Chloroflexi bacterium ADurb.Bin344]
MQWGIDQANNDRITGHGFEQTVKIRPLIWQQFIQRFRPFFGCLRQNHPLDDRQPFGFKEHMLRPAQADSFGSECPGAARVPRIIRIRPNFQIGDFVSPTQKGVQIGHFIDVRNNHIHFSCIHLASCTIYRNPIAFMQHQIPGSYRFSFQIDFQRRSADHTGNTELSGNNRCMGSGSAFGG